jgi:hypothetical protein
MNWGSAPDPGILGGMARCSRHKNELAPQAVALRSQDALTHLGPDIPGKLRPRRACFRFSGQLNCSTKRLLRAERHELTRRTFHVG